MGHYRYDGPDRGALRFFDVMQDPPRNGIPAAVATLSLDQLVTEIEQLVNQRNSTGIEWATLTEEMQGVEEGRE